MALARVQATPKQIASGVASITVTFGTAPAVGNGIVVAVMGWWPATWTFPTGGCTDNKGNTYTRVVEKNGNPHAVAIYYCPIVGTSGGTFTVTVNVSGGGTSTAYTWCVAVEVSGVGTGLVIDKTVSANGTGTAVATGSTAALTASEVFVMAAEAASSGQTTITVQSVSPSWTQEGEELTASITTGEMDSRILTSAAGTTTSCAWTHTSSANWWAILAAFSAGAPAAYSANVSQLAVEVASTSVVSASVTQLAVEVASPFGSGISLTINGVEQILDDYGIGLLRATLRLEENLTARTVMSFKVRNPTEIPVIENTVLLTIDGVRHFGGIITTITEAPFGDGSIVYAITCSDWLAVADGILLNDISPAGTLMDVLEWMLTRLDEFGFSIDPAQDTGPTLEATAYPFQTYTNALNGLATSIDRIWRVDPYQRIRVMEGTAGPVSPVVLDNDHVFPNAQREITREGHASTVWVRFGSGTASNVTITTPGEADMVYVPPYIVSVGPTTVNVNGTDYPVLPAPGTGWRWDSSTGELTTDVALTGTDTVIYTVTVAWPSYAVASTTVGTDIYEVAVIVDYPNVFDAAVAAEIAVGELAKREGFPPIFHCTTVHPWFHAGEVVTIDLPLYGYDGEGLITAVRLQHVSRRGNAPNDPWWQFDIDVLTSTAIPRANWLDFWRSSTGGGSGATGVSGP